MTSIECHTELLGAGKTVADIVEEAEPFRDGEELLTREQFVIFTISLIDAVRSELAISSPSDTLKAGQERLLEKARQ